MQKSQNHKCYVQTIYMHINYSLYIHSKLTHFYTLSVNLRVNKCKQMPTAYTLSLIETIEPFDLQFDVYLFLQTATVIG